MTTNSSYLIKLHSLVIFRNLLQQPLIQKLLTMLSADPAADPVLFADAYSEFTNFLYLTDGDFSRSLLNLILEDENIFVHRYCQCKDQETGMEEILDHELTLLNELAALRSSTILAKADWSEYLPAWKNSEVDIVQEYKNRLQEIQNKGFGIFSKYHSFLYKDGKITPVKHPDMQSLVQLPGYEAERSKVVTNTIALLNGLPANNVLLYGDAGTGKSSAVKAIANEYKEKGLRLLEIKKEQLFQLPELIEELAFNPLKFIIFIDDLSFNGSDGNFTALKAILEGSIVKRSANVVIYATSNRRHLIKETWEDRMGTDLHEADTRQEILSLSARFGLVVTFSKPDKERYLSIVHELASQYGLNIAWETLDIKAEAHALRNGGRSPRAAKQFIELTKSGI